ncbi:hypothetical protein D3C72_1373410 [compost metagenome]
MAVGIRAKVFTGFLRVKMSARCQRRNRLALFHPRLATALLMNVKTVHASR